MSSALEQFREDKRQARMLAKDVEAKQHPFGMLMSHERNLIKRALEMFADQDETKQNFLVIGNDPNKHLCETKTKPCKNHLVPIGEVICLECGKDIRL